MNFENRLPGILGCLHLCRIRLIGSRSCLGTHVSQPSSSRLLAQVRSSPLVALQESNNPGPVHKMDVLQARFLQRCEKPCPPSLVAKRGRQERRGKICKMTPPLGQPAAFVCSHYALPIHRAKCDKPIRWFTAPSEENSFQISLPPSLPSSLPLLCQLRHGRINNTSHRPLSIHPKHQKIPKCG